MTAPSLKQIALADLEQELATTRRALERVPDDRLDWKPHPRSMSLAALATHLAELPTYGIATLEGDEFNFAGRPPTKLAGSRDEILARFDANVAALRPLIEALEDDALHRPWSLRNGDQLVFTLPRAAVLRSFLINHIVHHRAQLGVYLRLLDVPVPSSYGPTADEEG